MKTLLPVPLLLALLYVSPAKAEVLSFSSEDAVENADVAEKVDVSWNECSGQITGNYTGASCIKSRKMDNEFETYLKQHIMSCVNAGLSNVGGGSALSIHLIHDGVQADSVHSKRSLHALGRAIDIQQLRVKTDKGSRNFDFRITSNNPNGTDRKFYEGFRNCWGSLMRLRGCPRRNSGAPVGTIGWEDGRHRNHHLHTSLPFCPNSRGYFTTDFASDVEEDAEETGPYEDMIDI